MKGIVTALVESLRAAGHRPWHVEGMEQRRWVLIDLVDIVVHVFLPQAREYYGLERLWGDAEPMALKGEPESPHGTASSGVVRTTVRVETIEWIEPGEGKTARPAPAGSDPLARRGGLRRLYGCRNGRPKASRFSGFGEPPPSASPRHTALRWRPVMAIGKADFHALVEGALDRLAGTTADSCQPVLGAAADAREDDGNARFDEPLDEERLAGDLLATAHRIRKADREVCRRIGEHGAGLLSDGDKVLTHCNAGSLATAGCGTALGVVYGAVQQGKRVRVFADETRPLLQGSRLTAWELKQNGIDVTVICDGAAAAVMRTEGISSVIVGADRVAANGDVANKIGTYGLAVLAREHGIPFCVAAPMSTVDFQLASGAEIPIEERSPEEVSGGPGAAGTPPGVEILNPAFDVTPHHLIAGIITEHGVARPSFDAALSTWNQEHEEKLQRA